MDGVSAAASITALIGTAITLIQQVQNARDHMKRVPKTLENGSKQLEALVQSLNLVKKEERLQTPTVKQQVSVIKEISEELSQVFGRIRVGQSKNVLRRILHALTSAEKDDKELAEILNRLDRARDELGLRISVTLVGLVGNLKDGFQVAYGVLKETNQKVTKILGKDLVLANRLANRSQPDETVTLDTADIKALGLSDPNITASRIPMSQLRIDRQTGNIKVEGNVDEAANTGISAKQNQKGPAQVTSATIAGKTGNIDIGADAKGSLNTGISTYS